MTFWSYVINQHVVNSLPQLSSWGIKNSTPPKESSSYFSFESRSSKLLLKFKCGHELGGSAHEVARWRKKEDSVCYFGAESCMTNAMRFVLCSTYLYKVELITSAYMLLNSVTHGQSIQILLNEAKCPSMLQRYHPLDSCVSMQRRAWLEKGR